MSCRAYVRYETWSTHTRLLFVRFRNSVTLIQARADYCTIVCIMLQHIFKHIDYRWRIFIPSHHPEECLSDRALASKQATSAQYTYIQ